MSRTRMFLIAGLLLAATVGTWLWWIRPQAIDMSTYAPADSLVYLEANNPTDIVATLANTDAWKLVDDVTGDRREARSNNWSAAFVKWTGIGPTNSVIATRAQIAVVVTDLSVLQDNESLTVKPEGALLVETHTGATRIKPSLERILKKFAVAAYGQPTPRRTIVDGFEFIEWIAPEGKRQVVATIVGSLIIVGNTERAVQKTLAVALHRSPSLKDDQDLKQLRLDLQAKDALAFGYVPATSSGRLLSVALPMVLGRAPDNGELERLIDSASAKVVASLGWSARSRMGVIEDRYRINLNPGMIPKLKEGFSCQQADQAFSSTLPENLLSVTYYRFENPTEAWQGLKTSVAAQVDALSAIFFSSLLKSALLPYGINEPEKFLSLVKGPIITLRLDPDSTGSMLIARMRDESAMRELLVSEMGFRSIDGKPKSEVFTEGEFVARFTNGSIAIGSDSDVAHYVETAGSPSAEQSKASEQISSSFSADGACVLTYTNDTERVRAFISTVVSAQGGKAVWSDRTEQTLRSLPYSATETELGEHGIIRVTRSSLGQFSTLLPLVFPEQQKSNEHSR